MSMATRSVGMSPIRPFFTASRLSFELTKASKCRAFVTTKEPALSFMLCEETSRFFISSIPSVSEAVIFMIDDAPFMSESGAGFKSHLFQTATRFIPESKFSSEIFCSADSTVSVDESSMYKTVCADEAFSIALLIPSVSITSDVSRIPAVSINLNSVPSITQVSSITSLVVPAMSETIALSSPTSAFNRVDFPAFGAPRMAIGTPDFIAFPALNESARDRADLCES